MSHEIPWREPTPKDRSTSPTTTLRTPVPRGTAAPLEPLWFKDAVIYELRVRAFYDGNGDGIGDFKGLTEKLPYLQDLGVTALWLLPFYPSPLRDDGYDISDYTDVHPDCGTLADFKVFLKEAHRRGLKVITELVLNHTSDQHAWFQRARHAPPGSRARDFYVWSDTPDRFSEARVIFQDFERSNWTWDPVAKAYYWHRFYSHQPDLNFDNPAVKRAMFQVLDFWLGLGVDGVRLDAVPYLFEREGTGCENLPETHAYLRELRAHVDARFPGRMLLAEANQWPEDAAAYLAGGDECHMAFHFPIMPRLFMALQMEDRYPVTDILAQTPPLPESSQWALFLRNHDELTLEMVTEEERDFMYQVYARDTRMRINLGIRRRLAPLLSNDRATIELLKALLMSLPGTPVLYYGDEIGMGDNVYLGDRNGVRTPMQWSPDRNAGFSRANPQQLYLPVIVDPEHHYEAVNVEAQQQNTTSLLWWSKRMIALRKKFKAFGRGSIEFLHPDNYRVLAFVREHAGERILVVANLSRFAQHVELDLSPWSGRIPTELMGRTPFPAIGGEPYRFTLAPHGYYWFSLEEPVQDAHAETERPLPTLPFHAGLSALLSGEGRGAVEAALPGYLRATRWFGGKAKPLQKATIRDVVPLRSEDPPAALALLQVEYDGAATETWLAPLAAVFGEEAERLRADRRAAIVAQLASRTSLGVLCDALVVPSVQGALLELFSRGRPLRGSEGELLLSRRAKLKEISGPLPTKLVGAEQSNTSVIFGEKLIFKLLRRLEEGTNPEVEIGDHLSRQGFPHAPALAATVEYRRGLGDPTTVGVVHEYVPNHGDAWTYTLEELARFLERAAAEPAERLATMGTPGNPVATLDEPLPGIAGDLVGPFLGAAHLLGKRTGELHQALAQDGGDPAFAPEPYTVLYQRSVYQSMRNRVVRVFRTLRTGGASIPEDAREGVARLLEKEGALLNRLEPFLKHRLTAKRTRTHGDFHLGQVLYTGNDFAIIDFEGEPARTVADRRRKRVPIRDVAGMLRSFHYAAVFAEDRFLKSGLVAPERAPEIRRWARLWQAWTGRAYLSSWLEATRDAGFLPDSREELRTLVDAFMIDKALYEIGYELNSRPKWLFVPVEGVLELVQKT